MFREHLAGMDLQENLWSLDSKGLVEKLFQKKCCIVVVNLMELTVMMMHALYTYL
jgi:hypothetical protein